MVAKERGMLHCVISVRIVGFIAALAFVHEFSILLHFLHNSYKYVCVPAKLLVGSLREIPLVLGDVGHSLQLIAQLVCQGSLLHLVVHFFLHVDSIDGSAFVPVLHQQKGVVVGLLGEEIDLARLVYLEVFIDSLLLGLFIQGLSVDAHFLN